MTRPMVRIYSENGVFVDREMNDEEFAQHKLDQAEIAKIAAEEEKKIAARIELLNRLGITTDEAKLLLA
jgi:hypothetical protein